MEGSPKRKVLNLADRVKVLELADQGMSSRKIADRFDIGRTQVQTILKRKVDVLNDFDNNASPDRKRSRHASGYEEVNDLTWRWFQNCVGRQIIVNGPMIKEKALKFAGDLRKDTFKASNGWLERFIKRNNIVFGTQSGERGDVDKTVVSDWKKKLPDVCSGYRPEDIFNMDETGLFFRDTTRTTFHVKGDDCSGGKRSKERITVALCASLTGEKLTPLIIGKSRRPRAFKHIKSENLPVIYRNNKKAWMNSYLFEEWIKSMDKKFKRQNRYVLLFIDNAPSHPHLKLTNIELKFFPANTTSLSQPMDQGIIQATKLKFRKRQLRHMLSEMDRLPGSTGSDLLKQTSILDAIYWLDQAWREVETSTITKCFCKCGFGEILNSTVDDDSDYDPEDDVPLSVIRLSSEVYQCALADTPGLDSDVKTCDTAESEAFDWNRSAADIMQELKSTDANNDDDSDDEDVATVGEPDLVLCNTDIKQKLYEIKQFYCQKGYGQLLGLTMQLETEHDKLFVKHSKQKSITDYFGKS